MDEEKQIEEIRKVVSFNCNKEGIAKRCPERIANGIYEAGYRNQSETAKEILKWLKILYAERQKEYTNWDGNKIKAVTIEWLNTDIECIAEIYGVKID